LLCRARHHSAIELDDKSHEACQERDSPFLYGWPVERIFGIVWSVPINKILITPLD
jgi:hypothetical protein